MLRHGLFLLTIFLFFTVSAYAQVAINNTGAAPVSSAILDVSSSNMGLLIPRMQLSELDNSSSPVSDPVTGLLIFNTVESPEVPVGFYYWSGSIWTQVMGDNNQTINNISSQMYEAAELYEDNGFATTSSINLGNPNTYYGWINATEGEIFGNTSTNVADATADKIIVGEDGLYKVEFTMSFSGTNNFELEVTVFQTTAETGTPSPTRVRTFRKLAALDIGAGSSQGLIRMRAGDAIDIRFRPNDSWGETIYIHNVNLIVDKVGE